MLAVAGPYILCSLHIIVFVQISITDCIHNNRCSQTVIACLIMLPCLTLSDYICYYSVSDYVCDKAVVLGKVS